MFSGSILFCLALYISCTSPVRSPDSTGPGPSPPKFVKEILPPQDCSWSRPAQGSFDEWLAHLPLRADHTVYLYNGDRKKNQSAQFAVLDMPVGTKDLQQCADAIMRMRAQWLLDQKRFDEIWFSDNANKQYQWKGKGDHKKFEQYLETVFGMCGTASLEKMLMPVHDLQQIQPGDVWIKGGFPGHAMMVVAVTQNSKGEKYFMLAQSYMPAQDIHIVKNPLNKSISPWYSVKQIGEELITPEWMFQKNQLRRWK